MWLLRVNNLFQNVYRSCQKKTFFPNLSIHKSVKLANIGDRNCFLSSIWNLTIDLFQLYN